MVSNAGRQQQCEDLLQLTTEAFDATMKTNIYAPFWIIRAALPHLKAGFLHHRDHLRAGLRSGGLISTTMLRPKPRQ